MKLFSESFNRLLEKLRSVKGCGRNYVMSQSSKFYPSLCQDVSKVYIVSKFLIVPKPKLVVVLKKKGVLKLKIRPLEKVIFGSADTLTALMPVIMRFWSNPHPYLGNLALFGQDLPPLGQI